MQIPVILEVNGQQYARAVEPRLLLVHFLRDVGGPTGTKVGCDPSQCGSCTVILDGTAVKSCTCLAVQADGAGVTTIEGLATHGTLSRIQNACSAKHGLQCGFCTPGMVIATHALLQSNPQSQSRPDPSWPRRQHVPLHRVPEHRPSGTARRRSTAMSTATRPMPRICGSGVKRREDPRLLTATARYTEDIV